MLYSCKTATSLLISSLSSDLFLILILKHNSSIIFVNSSFHLWKNQESANFCLDNLQPLPIQIRVFFLHNFPRGHFSDSRERLREVEEGNQRDWLCGRSWLPNSLPPFRFLVNRPKTTSVDDETNMTSKPKRYIVLICVTIACAAL